MSFGTSVGDVILLAQLAWKTVDNTRKACEEHDELAQQVLGLQRMLCRLEREIKKPESPINRDDDSCTEELRFIATGSYKVLNTLDKILEKYNGLSESERSVKRLWKQVKFGNGQIADIIVLRGRLTYYTSALSLFLNMISMGSMGRVEKQMDDAGDDLREIKISIHGIAAQLMAAGYHEGSVLTDYADDDRAVWKEFRRELVKDGFSSSTLREHKAIIKAYIAELGSRGLLDDEHPKTAEEKSSDEVKDVESNAIPRDLREEKPDTEERTGLDMDSRMDSFVDASNSLVSQIEEIEELSLDSESQEIPKPKLKENTTEELTGSRHGIQSGLGNVEDDSGVKNSAISKPCVTPENINNPVPVDKQSLYDIDSVDLGNMALDLKSDRVEEDGPDDTSEDVRQKRITSSVSELKQVNGSSGGLDRETDEAVPKQSSHVLLPVEGQTAVSHTKDVNKSVSPSIKPSVDKPTPLDALHDLAHTWHHELELECKTLIQYAPFSHRKSFRQDYISLSETVTLRVIHQLDTIDPQDSNEARTVREELRKNVKNQLCRLDEAAQADNLLSMPFDKQWEFYYDRVVPKCINWATRVKSSRKPEKDDYKYRAAIIQCTRYLELVDQTPHTQWRNPNLQVRQDVQSMLSALATIKDDRDWKWRDHSNGQKGARIFLTINVAKHVITSQAAAQMSRPVTSLPSRTEWKTATGG